MSKYSNLVSKVGQSINLTILVAICTFAGSAYYFIYHEPCLFGDVGTMRHLLYTISVSLLFACRASVPFCIIPLILGLLSREKKVTPFLTVTFTEITALGICLGLSGVGFYSLGRLYDEVIPRMFIFVTVIYYCGSACCIAN